MRACEEIADGRRNLTGMGFQGEVTGFKEGDFCLGDIALERFSTKWQEKRIVSAPHRKEGWFVSAEIFLKIRIEGDVAFAGVTHEILVG